MSGDMIRSDYRTMKCYRKLSPAMKRRVEAAVDALRDVAHGPGDSNVRRVVNVHLLSFKSIHRRFDRNELRVFSGRADGTDRRLTRGRDEVIRDINTRVPVIPRFLVDMSSTRPLTKLGRRLKRDCMKGIDKPLTWVYGHGGEFRGAKFRAQGKVYSAAKLKSQVCQRSCCASGCSSPSLLKCSGCQYVSYCSLACQRAHWSFHSSECATLAKASRCRSCENCAEGRHGDFAHDICHTFQVPNQVPE